MTDRNYFISRDCNDCRNVNFCKRFMKWYYNKFNGEGCSFFVRKKKEISLCKNCNCMTHTINKKCGKCGKVK